jgi:hypothetical protein
METNAGFRNRSGLLDNILQRPDHRWIERAKALVPWLIGLAFVAVEIRRVATQITVRYPDFFAWAERAARFDFRHLSQWDWVNGLYPLGYPLLLRLGVGLGLDVLRAAFVISILGGFLGLIGTYWLVLQMTDNWALAVLSQATLACMSFYLFFANLDATDMLSAGLQILSIAVLFGGTAQRGKSRFSLAYFAVAGLLAGLAYLIRYTASLTILLCILFLLGLALTRRRREDVMIVGAYLLGALVGAAPQLIASTIIEGNPIYSHQAHNLWFHLTGSSDYIRDWNAVPMDISLWEVISDDPGRFFGHWWAVFRSAWRTGDAVALDVPFGMLVQAALLFAVLVPGILKRSARAFLALYIVGMLALLSFTRFDRRFLITLMPFEILAVLYFLWSVFPATARVRRFAVPVRALVLLLLVLQFVSYPLRFMRANPPDTQIVDVSNALRTAGMGSARDVLSTHVDFHDVTSPWKWRYDMAFVRARNLGTYEELQTFLQEQGYRFFLFDKQTGVFLYPDLEYLRYPENRPAGLAPVFVHDKRDFAIYRVTGGNWPDPRPLDAGFENGVLLTGYELYQSSDMPQDSGRSIGIYLHWEATSAVNTLLKVFVHVFDETGQLVTQHDGMPALWTQPISEWNVGETVIDFHPLMFDGAQGRGPFTVRVGLYDAGTGQRIMVQDSSMDSVTNTGDGPTKDSVVLETFFLRDDEGEVASQN